MTPIKNITGWSKRWHNVKIRKGVFLHFLPRVLSGKINLKAYVQILRRLNFFLGALQENKFVKVGVNVKPGLYIPGFPSKAFFTACDKFSTFDSKLPCATVLISITSACRFKCGHCYQKNDKGKDVALPLLIETFRKLQDMGISFFNVEGGEPFLVFDRLLAVCEALDNRSEIWVNSTGDGMSMEKLVRLKKAGVSAVMFSLHSSSPESLNRFMGADHAWHTMEEGVRMCHVADIAVAFNTCMSTEDFHNGQFEAIMKRAKEYGASIIQIIKPKPAGGWLNGGASIFSPEDFELVKEKVQLYNHHRDYRDYPAISAQIVEEDRKMFGCTAGGTDRFYINAKGDVQPCEFLNISFGNIAEEPFSDIYRRMRNEFKEPADCMLCEKYSNNIADAYKKLGLKSLPLDKIQSQAIYKAWHRGAPTPLYSRIEKELC